MKNLHKGKKVLYKSEICDICIDNNNKYYLKVEP